MPVTTRARSHTLHLPLLLIVLCSACSTTPPAQTRAPVPAPGVNAPAPAAPQRAPATGNRPSAATPGALIPGNQVSLLFDGPQTFAAMRQAISSAQNHINLETYIFDQDKLGMEFAELLMARQRAGVQVNIIYDDFGTLSTPREFFEQMRAAGIRLLRFNPLNPLRGNADWDPNHREHRKILNVDGKVGFTGGVNISGSYSNGSMFRARAKQPSKVGWRDTHLKIEGPAVAALQKSFLDTWESQQEPAPKGNFFPALEPVGNKQVRVLASEPDGPKTVHQAYLDAIGKAKKTVHITCAYFAPDEAILQALYAAAARGVDVKLILPSVSDSSMMLYVAQSFYDEMLARGIKIYQLKLAVLHAKTAVIDRHWATIGSANLDQRSFLNSEINLVILGDEFGTAMENAFMEDLRSSTEITQQDWAQRGIKQRTQEWLMRRFAGWL